MSKAAATAPEDLGDDTDGPDADALASLDGVQPAISESGLSKLATTFWLIAAFLLVFSYVFSIMWPYPIPMLFDITMPTPQIMALLAIPVIVLARCGPNWKLGVPITIFIAGLAVNAIAWRQEFHLGAHVELLGYIAIPLAVAILRREGRLPTLPALATFALALFVYQIGQTIAAVLVGRQTVGLAGNRNWEACYMLVLAPWAFYAAYHWLHQLAVAAKFPASKRLIAGAAAVIIAPCLIYVLHHCDSRAAYVAIAAMAIAPVYWFQPLLGRVLLVVFLLLLALVALDLSARFAPVPFERALKADVRLPMWQASVKMTADNDWLAGFVDSLVTGNVARWTDGSTPAPSGVGPGRFQKAFVTYRARSKYHERKVAADTSIHPHNELLNVIGQVGVLPGLAWAAILLLAMREPRSPMDWLARLSAAAGITCAMLDMPLVRAPASLAIWIVIGLALSDRLIPLPGSWSREAGLKVRRVLGGLSVLILVIGVIAVTSSHVRSERYYRLGRIAAALGVQTSGETAATFYDEAAVHYNQSLKAKPHDLLVRYHLATLYLNRMNDENRALPELLRIQEEDPNYIHINKLLSTVYLKQGDVSKAMIYASREVDLYPLDPVALHEWMFLLAFTSNLKAAADVQTRIDTILPVRIRQKRSEADAADLLRAWHTDVLAGRLEDAKDRANALLYDDDSWLKREDPLYIEAIQAEKWALLLRRSEFGIDDATYWHFCLQLDAFLPRTGDHLHDVQTALRALAPRLTIDPARRDFPMPHHLLKGSTGSTWSAYAMAVQVAYVRGLPAVLLVDAEGQPISIMVQTDTEAMICDWRGQNARRVSLKDWGKESHGAFALQVFYPYSACQLRNQMLARCLALYTPELTGLPDMIPTFTTAYQYQSWTGREPRFEDLSPLFSRREILAIKAGIGVAADSTPPTVAPLPDSTPTAAPIDTSETRP